MRHPIDGHDWRTINTMFYKDIGREVRHLWFALSTDGMNHFDQVRSNHSTWPVMLCIYNLPPWLYMKRSYLQMPLLIQGPRQPGNDIDVFLEPVIDELVEMFEKGVPDVWDEYKKEHVTIKEYLSLQSLTCQVEVRCPERRQKAILDVPSAWTTPML